MSDTLFVSACHPHSPPCVFGAERHYDLPMRYFSCTVEIGHVYVHYIEGVGISYHTLEEVGRLFNELRDRRVDTVEELDELLRESIGRPLPFGMIYVAEGLEDETRWRAGLTSSRR